MSKFQLKIRYTKLNLIYTLQFDIKQLRRRKTKIENILISSDSCKKYCKVNKVLCTICQWRIVKIISGQGRFYGNCKNDIQKYCPPKFMPTVRHCHFVDLFLCILS